MDRILAIPRVPLACLPTPLQPAPKLAARAGINELYIKRDDLTGLAGGGNKARKLEFELAPAVHGKYDSLLTVGGKQSNHARMVAAAAAKLGLECKLALGGVPIAAMEGNLLLNAMLGAEIRYINGSDDDDLLAVLMASWVKELQAAGGRPYALPLGGSTPLGAIGYVQAVQELSGQLNGQEAQIVLPVGSCGTFAGCVLGARLYMPGSTVIGISVSRSKRDILERAGSLVADCAGVIGVDPGNPLAHAVVYDGFHAAYAQTVPGAENAIALCAATEGLLLDSIYTGKAMYGLLQLAAAGKLEKGKPVVFLHTGGLPIIFTKHISGKDYRLLKNYSIEEVQRLY